MNPYEIRLAVLQLATQVLSTERSILDSSKALPISDNVAAYNASSIINTAQTLYAFVSDNSTIKKEK